jgi:YbbR domain-containing protein
VEVEGVRGVRVIDVQPRTIIVNLEDLATRQVSVVARAVGSPPLGYQIGAVTPQTASARVSGPESLVALIDQAVADVNVTGLTVNVQQNIVLKAVGTGGAEIRGVRLEPANVPVNVEVIQTTIVRTVPLAVDVAGEPDPGYAVSRVASSPSAIQVQGPIEVLQQIDRIRLPAVSVAGARSDVVRSVQIPLPAGLSYVDRDRATVTVTVTPAAGSRRTTLAVEVLNVAPGRVGRVSGSGSVDVIIEGPLPVLNATAVSELRATVDAAGAALGTLTLQVNVRTPEGVTVKSVQPATVTVTIGAP